MSAPNHGERADARKRHAEAQQGRALVEAIAATLAEHGARRVTCGDEWIWECTAPDCAWIDARIHEGLDAHRYHLATILAEQEAERRKVSLDAERERNGQQPPRGWLES